MNRFTATLLAALALSASVQAFGQETANDPQACPAGTTDATPSYKWANGHLVRDGWFCENRSAN
jgi:hypothetical protein